MGRSRYVPPKASKTPAEFPPGEEKRCSAKAKLLPLPLEKAKFSLEGSTCPASASGTRTAAFLVMAGAFDPVRKAHMAALESARRAVEKLTGLPVVVAFIAPWSDEEVLARRSASSGQDEEPSSVRPLEQRCRLCSLASASSAWIEVCPWGWTNALRTCDRIAKQLSDRLCWVGGHWDFQAWWVVGNEGLLQEHLRLPPRWGLQFCDLPVVSVAAAGISQLVMHAAATKVERSSLGKKIAEIRRRRFTSPQAALLVSAEHCEAASSSEIRSLVASEAWDKLAGVGVLSEAVVESLQSPTEPPSADEERMDAPQSPPAACPAGKGFVKFTTGEAVKANQSGGKKIIAHVCNDQGNGGRGYFQAIKLQWGPGPSRAYFEWHRDRTTASDRGDSNGFRLGAVQFVEVSPLVEVASMIGFQGSRSGSRGAPVRYSALEEALEAVGCRASLQGASVHMPHACGGGLQWDQMSPLVKAMAAKHAIAVYVYRES